MISARRPVAAAAAALALSLTLSSAGHAAPGGGQVSPPTNPTTATMTLLSQTAWVMPGQNFGLRIRIEPATAIGTLTVTVFSPVPNRTEFTRTLSNKIDESIISRAAIPLAALPADASGARTVLVATQDPTKPRVRSRLSLYRSGAYPVRLEYRPDAGTTPLSLVSHLLYVNGPIGGDKLHVAWILPVHATPQLGPNGTEVLPPDQSDRLAALAAVLDAHHDLPIVLQPTPDTIAALAESQRQEDRTTLAVLSRPESHRQLVTGTYVPVPLPGMLAAGLADDATAQLTQGSEELATNLSIRPDGRTWVENGSIDEVSTAFLRGAQVDRMVVPEQALSTNPLPITLAQPFQLAVHPESQVQAAAADAGLAAHFSDAPDPVLAAHQLLADLTVIYLDRPGLTRGVVAATPISWAPNATFLRVFFDALSASPVLASVTLDTLFATIPMATTRPRQPMVRTLVPDARTGFDASTFPVSALRAARTRLDGFGNALTADNPIYGAYQRILLTAESSDLVLQHDRQAQVDLVNKKINGQLALLQLPTARTITLTSRTGDLPITIQSGADYPLRVVLRVESDKLSFPQQGARGSASETIELHHGNNPFSFTVQARTAGAFPMRITLLAPDGHLMMASTSFTVQSTALSGVGLFLSIGAGLFLAVWWARHAWRGRRARRLLDAQPAIVLP